MRKLVTLLSVFLFSWGLAQTAVNQGDSLALVAFYNATGGDSWTDNSNWLTSEPVANWFGVGVTDSGRVGSLSLVDNNLSGYIPSEFQNLNELKTLFITKASIDSIQSGFGNLSKLYQLQLDECGLKSIPAEIGQLTALYSLRLKGNQLSSLPEEIGYLKNVWEADFSNNDLTSIPDSIGNMSNLYRIYFTGNKLTGLPNGIGNLSSLQELLLDDNEISTLPDSLQKLSILYYLNLNHNKLTTIPLPITKLPMLSALYIGYNEIASLPDEIGNMTQLDNLLLNDNKLTSLPDGFSNLTLSLLDLSDNNISTLPSSIGSLGGNLNIQNNMLTEFGPALLNQNNLRTLDLSYNRIETFPDSLVKMSALQNLWLNHNKIDTVGFFWASAALKKLYLSNNEMTYLSSSIGDFTTLTHLHLDSNKLEDLPNELINLSNASVYVNNNQLQFGPLERILSLNPQFGYFGFIPQDTLGGVIDTVLQRGDTFSMSVTISGSSNYNSYQWIQNVLQVGSTVGYDSVYVISDYSPEMAGAYYCRITNSNVPGLNLIAGRNVLHNPVGIEDENLSVRDYRLYDNYPNPFNPITSIRYDLSTGGSVNLGVYNVLGQKVRTLVKGYKKAGKKTVVWNGLDDSGQLLPSGTYFYRLQTRGKSIVKKMILMK